VSSKELAPFALSLKQCERDLDEFKQLLASQLELREREDILPFFRSRPHLSAFIGALHIPVDRIDRLAHELDVFGHFRVDLAVGDSAERAYTLVEFEDASASSVFVKGHKYNDQWGARLEGGFSQLVDWFWTIADQRHTNDFARRFGGSDARFYGMLVVGRKQALPSTGAARMAWRSEHILLAGQKVTCITFDDLLDALESRIKYLRAITDAGDLT
jgi:hypothetical protein